MKTKKLNKKLTLNKITVSALNPGEMKKSKAGAPPAWTIFTCILGGCWTLYGDCHTMVPCDETYEIC